MDAAELVQVIPDFLASYLEGAQSRMIFPPVEGLNAGAWALDIGGGAVGIKLLGNDSGELRINVGLALEIPYQHSIAEYVNRLNVKELIFGRAFFIPFVPQGIDTPCAVLMQEIVFGTSLSFDFPPSMQNLLELVARMNGQGDRMASELIEQFGGRRFAAGDDDGVLVMY